MSRNVLRASGPVTLASGALEIGLLLLLLLFFPRLISVVGGWMSTILPHMVWP